MDQLLTVTSSKLTSLGMKLRMSWVFLTLLASSQISHFAVGSTTEQPVNEAAANDVRNNTICDRNASEAEKEFDRRFPPPPSFIVPPPPSSFVLTNGSAKFAWKLVPSSDADQDIPWIDFTSPEAKCLHPDIKPPEVDSTTPNNGGISRENVTDPNWTSNATAAPDVNATEPCSTCQPCVCVKQDDLDSMRGAEGPPGPIGPQGPTGTAGQTGPRGPRGRSGKKGSRGAQGLRGIDGVPGLVSFSSAAAMLAVELEGLIAYRTDVKQLFIRDDRTWRLIKLSKCGDNVVDSVVGEQCDDGNDDKHDDCIDCRKSYCGDGVRNPRTEQCDGRDFGNQSCATKGNNMTGVLECRSNCTITYRRCRFRRQHRRN